MALTDVMLCLHMEVVSKEKLGWNTTARLCPKPKKNPREEVAQLTYFSSHFPLFFLPAVPLIHAHKWTYQKPPHSHSVFQPAWNQEIPGISSRNLFPNFTEAFNTFSAWTEFRSMTKVPSPLRGPVLLLHGRTAVCRSCCWPRPFQLFSVLVQAHTPRAASMGPFWEVPSRNLWLRVVATFLSSSLPLGQCQMQEYLHLLMVSKSNPNSSIIVFMLWGTKHFTASRAGPKCC